MEQAKLSVRSRSENGKGPNRRLRAEGRVPAIIYGAGLAIEKVSIETHGFERALATNAENTIYSIVLEGDGAKEERAAVVREVQRDPVTRNILHVDLYRIRMDVENDFEVPVHGTGLAAGAKEGGVLETHLHAIEVRCLPTRLPASIDVDLSDLQIGHSIHVGDLQIPEGVTVLSDPEQVIFTILATREETAAATEEVAQPEVITKKKAEE